jgi:SAM-dependent methyltransferase
MKYDPVKNIFATLIDKSDFMRIFFYFILDMMILRQWYVKKLIKKYFSKNQNFTFYDAGAGFCQYTHFIRKHFKNADIVSMDLKTDYMESYNCYAKRTNQNEIEIYQGDLQYFVCPKNTDLVIAVDIMEHILDDIAVLNNIYQKMNHDGRLIISTPSNLDKAAAFTEEHVRPGYDPEELKNKVKNAGFVIEELKFSYGFWGKIYWFLGMKIPLSLTGISKLFILLLPFYFIPVLPLNLIFMTLDLSVKNNKGNGIILSAKKI